MKQLFALQALSLHGSPQLIRANWILCYIRDWGGRRIECCFDKHLRLRLVDHRHENTFRQVDHILFMSA